MDNPNAFSDDGCESIFSPIHRMKIPKEVSRSPRHQDQETKGPLVPLSPPHNHSESSNNIDERFEDVHPQHGSPTAIQHPTVPADDRPISPSVLFNSPPHPSLRRRCASVDYSFLFPCRPCAPYETPYPVSTQQRNARFRAYHMLVESPTAPQVGTCEFYRELDRLTLLECKRIKHIEMNMPIPPRLTPAVLETESGLAPPRPPSKPPQFASELLAYSRSHSIAYMPSNSDFVRLRSAQMERRAQDHGSCIPPLCPTAGATSGELPPIVPAATSVVIDRKHDGLEEGVLISPTSTFPLLAGQSLTTAKAAAPHTRDARRSAITVFEAKQRYLAEQRTKARKNKKKLERSLEQDRLQRKKHIESAEELHIFARDLGLGGLILAPEEEIEEVVGLGSGLGALSEEEEEEEEYSEVEPIVVTSEGKYIHLDRTPIKEGEEKQMISPSIPLLLVEEIPQDIEEPPVKTPKMITPKTPFGKKQVAYMEQAAGIGAVCIYSDDDVRQYNVRGRTLKPLETDDVDKPTQIEEMDEEELDDDDGGSSYHGGRSRPVEGSSSTFRGDSLAPNGRQQSTLGSQGLASGSGGSEGGSSERDIVYSISDEETEEETEEEEEKTKQESTYFGFDFASYPYSTETVESDTEQRLEEAMDMESIPISSDLPSFVSKATDSGTQNNIETKESKGHRASHLTKTKHVPSLLHDLQSQIEEPSSEAEEKQKPHASRAA